MLTAYDRYSPFKDEPTQGFVGPRRGAQSFLKELDFLLQALWTKKQTKQDVSNVLSDVVNSNTSCVDDILTEISLSAQDRSICTDFMSSLFWLISSDTLCN